MPKPPKFKSTYEPHWHLKGKPYAVQIEALKRSWGRSHFAHFCEQGMGKSAIVLNDYLENFKEFKTVVILCPNSFKQDWASLPFEWGFPDCDTAIHPYEPMEVGRDRTRINIMNFEAVRSGGFDKLDFVGQGPCMLIVDESSAIKNYRSDTAKAVLDLSKRASAVRLLNGTPMSQNVMDLFPQLKCLGELNGMNPFVFRNRYAQMGGFMGKQVVGLRHEHEIQDILNRCSFRALKKDWSDLPPKIEIPVRLEMTQKQAKLYREMLEDFFTLVDEKEFSANAVLAQCEKLRQITSGCLLNGDDFVLIEDPKDNPKIQATLDIIRSGPGKVIVVHFYKKMGEVILDVMKKNKLVPAYIRGGMTPEEIKFQKTLFNRNPKSRVMVAQITAASRAHTLVGEGSENRCHRMIFHDATFSMLDRSQMVDRIHRGEQDQTCLYYDLICSPIDEAQLAAVKSKQDVASRVVDAVRYLRSGGKI